MANFREPSINAPDLPGQVRQILSYLRQLVRDLNFLFDAMEKRDKEEKTEPEKPTPPIQWPVGTVYRTVAAINPKNVFGGRWEQRADDGEEHVWVRIS